MSYNTIWVITDEVWEIICPLLPAERAPGTRGRPPLPHRQVLEGILYVLRSGTQWKGLRKEWFGASTSLHDKFQEWREQEVWEKVFQTFVDYYDRHCGIQWKWQAIDSKSVAAPLGGDKTGPNPTDRGKSGAKRHILTDGRGAPLGIVLSGANTHDKTCALELLDTVADRRPSTTYRVHHLCADKGYDYIDVRNGVAERNYQEHIKHRGEDDQVAPDEKRYPARRWVVERTLSWQNDFRSLRTRWAKKSENWLAFIQLASALVLWNITNHVI